MNIFLSSISPTFYTQLFANFLSTKNTNIICMYILTVHNISTHKMSIKLTPGRCV